MRAPLHPSKPPTLRAVERERRVVSRRHLVTASLGQEHGIRPAREDEAWGHRRRKHGAGVRGRCSQRHCKCHCIWREGFMDESWMCVCVCVLWKETTCSHCRQARLGNSLEVVGALAET